MGVGETDAQPDGNPVQHLQQQDAAASRDSRAAQSQTSLTQVPPADLEPQPAAVQADAHLLCPITKASPFRLLFILTQLLELVPSEFCPKIMVSSAAL